MSGRSKPGDRARQPGLRAPSRMQDEAGSGSGRAKRQRASADTGSGQPVAATSIGPLSRPVSVAHLTADGVDEKVEATVEERAALAADFGLEAIHSLTGSFALTGSPRRVRVTGRVDAAITQTCVVTLEPFDSVVEEVVEAEFADPDLAARLAGEQEEPPEPMEGSSIDLGRLTAEFLALGLDPYPRKPGTAFSFETEGDADASPFAALGRLRDGQKDQ